MEGSNQFKMSITPTAFNLGDIAELYSDRGMLFHTPEARDDFFQRAKESPEHVPYGAALSHARGSNLGIWGNEERLYNDCSRIMALELQRLQHEIRAREPHYRFVKQVSARYRKETDIEINEHDVARSPTFQAAFDLVRRPKEAAKHNFVRALGANSRHMDRMNGRISEHELGQSERLHVRMLAEIYTSSARHYR